MSELDGPIARSALQKVTDDVMSDASIKSADAALVAALQRGEAAAFERLVSEFGPRMRSVIFRYVRDDADADDALQDAFISAGRAIARFNQDSALSTWLHTIAVRAALMKLRSKRRWTDEQSIDALLPTYDRIGHRVLPESPSKGLPEQASIKETQQRVRDCIDQLPEMYRAVLLARDIEQLSTEESADVLGMTIPALKTRLHRARAALRTLLEPLIRSGSI